MPRGRPKSVEVSKKQLEVFELLLDFIRDHGYQPNAADLSELLNVARPAIRRRLTYLVEKGFLKPPPASTERRYGFVGLKFLPYQVDPVTEQIVAEQEYDLGDYVVTFKKKKSKR